MIRPYASQRMQLQLLADVEREMKAKAVTLREMMHMRDKRCTWSGQGHSDEDISAIEVERHRWIVG